MPPIEACYRFAGYVGLPPESYTLRQLWMMADGRARNRRLENLELGQVVWTIGQFDPEEYLIFGMINQSNQGNDVELTDEQHAEVRRKIEEIKAANPDHPTIKGN